MDTVGTPALLDLRCPCPLRDGRQQIRVGELARFADEIRTLGALMGKTVG